MPREAAPTVRVCREGLLVGDQVVPLYAGSVHYWRLEPSEWRVCLEASRELGVRLIDVYVPWGVHELDKGRFDFGEVQSRNDVAAFLRLVHELGMYAIVRPGPHINAELSWFGIPKRVLWDERNQARSPSGKPVVLPVPPVAFPVPSFASETFLNQTTMWLEALGKVLSPLRWPEGPIVLVQVDNEATLYFRDGAYDQDWHPDALALYRKFLAHKYGEGASPRTAYGLELDSFAAMVPPARFEARSLDELPMYLDWAELQERMVTRFLRRVSKRLRKAGLGEVPTTHNLPIAEHAAPAAIGDIGRTVDLLGLDYYYVAGPASRRAIARRTSTLALRGDALGVPPFACELGAGFPFMLPAMSVRDNAFTVLTALAYGLRGFNMYMVVERDRWIGAPIDAHGRVRGSASFWRTLLSILDQARFASLRRPAPVRIITSRTQARLERVMHAFGPMSGAAFAVMGSGARQRCFEDELGTGSPVAIAGESFVERVEQALESEGLSFGHAWDDEPEVALHQARWAIVSTPAGAVDPAMLRALDRFARAGGCVTFGPAAPCRDAALRPLPAVPETEHWPVVDGVPLLLSGAAAAIGEAVHRARESLELPRLEVGSASLHATLHVDTQGRPAALFLINETTEAIDARIPLDLVAPLVDAWSGERLPRAHACSHVAVPARSVRMLLVPTDGAA